MANKTLIRLAQLTGSLDDSGGVIHPSAITDKSLQGVLNALASSVKRITGAATYSQAAAGSFSQTLLPAADDSYDLGSAAAAWQDLHMEGDVLMTDAGKVSTAAGDLTIESAAADVVLDAATDIVLDADGGDIRFKDGGATQIHFDMAGTGGAVIMKPGVDSDRMIFQQFDGTEVLGIEDDASLKIAGGAGSTGVTVSSAGNINVDGVSTLGATTGATVSAAGILNVNNTTEATSTTDGSLQTDGGLSVAKSVVIGDDLDLLSNAAILKVGSDQPFTLTHANASNTLLASSGHRLAFGDAGDYISGDGTDLLLVGSADVKVTGDLVPSADDTYDLGTTALAWQDLHLEGDIKAQDAMVVDTAAGNLSVNAAATLVLSGTAVDVDSAGVLALDGLGGVNLGVATSGVAVSIGHAVSEVTVNDNLTVTGDLTVNGATVTIDTTNLSVQDPVITLNEGGQALNANGGLLFTSGSSSAAKPGVAFGRVANDTWALGQIAVPTSGTMTTVAGMDAAAMKFRIGRLELDSAADYIELDTDVKVIAAADIVLDPGGNDVKVDGNVIPNSDSADSLGASGTAWANLYVDDIDLNGQGSISMGGTGRIDLDADDDTSIRASADDVITFEAGASDKMSMSAIALYPASDDGLALGLTSNNWSDLFLADAAVINLGDDQDVTLTHVADAGVLLGGTRYLSFADANSHISNPGAGLKLTDHAVIEVEAATSIQMDSPIIDFEDDGVILQFGDGDDVTLTHVHNTGLLLNSNMQLQFGDSATTIAQVADGILHHRADTQHLFDGGGSMNWHMTGSSRIGIADNSATAFAFQEGSNNLFAIATTNGTEVVRSFKLFQADANIKMNSNSSEIQIADSQAASLTVKNASGAEYFRYNTSNNFVGAPDNIGVGVGTGRDFQMKHNGTDTTLVNGNGLLIMQNAGGNLILSASAANSEIQFGDAYCGNIMTNGLFQLSDSAAEWNSFVSNFSAGKSLVGALNSLAEGGTRGKFQVAVTGSHAANIPLLINASLNHDQGSGGEAALDVFVNGQLLTSGTAIANGDYKIGITSPDHIQFFFQLESGDQVTVVKP